MCGVEYILEKSLMWRSSSHVWKHDLPLPPDGQGKTLLFQHIFNNEEIHGHFDYRVCLVVCQKFGLTKTKLTVAIQGK